MRWFTNVLDVQHSMLICLYLHNSEVRGEKFIIHIVCVVLHAYLVCSTNNE